MFLKNTLFSAATFLHFKFKKFEFIRNENERNKYLNMAKDYLKKYYINSLNDNNNNYLDGVLKRPPGSRSRTLSLILN